MAKYRKKPVVIEAFRITDKVFPEWANKALQNNILTRCTNGLGQNSINVNTLEGVMISTPTDYIIQGVQGELYPCKEDIFLATYESVTE